MTGKMEESGGSLEYLVFSDVLLAAAAKYSLYPISNYRDPDLNALFVQDDLNVPFKHFNFRSTRTNLGGTGLAEASGINFAFTFRKQSSTSQESSSY